MSATPTCCVPAHDPQGALGLSSVRQVNARVRIEVEHAFRNHRGGVRVLAAPNRGRDIGPFLSAAGRLLRDGGYEVVGHLHGKRSVEAGSGVGDRWRTHLLANLLGLGAGGLDAVLALFADDSRLGLLFAEDRQCVGWTDNRPVAEALAARLVPRPELPPAPVFPLGNMFWARPAALESLWTLGLQPSNFHGRTPAPRRHRAACVGKDAAGRVRSGRLRLAYCLQAWVGLVTQLNLTLLRPSFVDKS